MKQLSKRASNTCQGSAVTAATAGTLLQQNIPARGWLSHSDRTAVACCAKHNSLYPSDWVWVCNPKQHTALLGCCDLILTASSCLSAATTFVSVSKIESTAWRHRTIPCSWETEQIGSGTWHSTSASSSLFQMQLWKYNTVKEFQSLWHPILWGQQGEVSRNMRPRRKCWTALKESASRQDMHSGQWWEAKIYKDNQKGRPKGQAPFFHSVPTWISSHRRHHRVANTLTALEHSISILATGIHQVNGDGSSTAYRSIK